MSSPEIASPPLPGASSLEPTGGTSSDPLQVVDVAALSSDEAAYVAAARAANTLRGYRSDWAEWCAWAAAQGYSAMLASAEGISRYLTFLAACGAKVGTMSRRLSGIRFAHRMRNLPDPTAAARVIAVWEGIRRTHGAPAEQSAPLMPPELWDVVDRCPTTRTWKTPKRPPEPDLAGLRDQALLLVGFVAALRRSELAALAVDQVAEHPNGLVLAIARSTTNQTAERAELAVLPRARMASRARSRPSRRGSARPRSPRAPCSGPSPPVTARATDH